MATNNFNTKSITIQDMKDILEEMAEYYNGCMEFGDESVYGYFNEIVNSGLFHDAIGKLTMLKKDKAEVITDY